MMRKYLLPILILVPIGGFYLFRHFYYKAQIFKKHYGVKANPLRQKLYIPVIDDYMMANRHYSGMRWDSKNELPQNNKVLHVWKSITPLSDTAGLYEESDAFRKRFNDTLVYQFNIFSKIIGDTLATREGKLFFYNRTALLEIDLNDYKIDSVAKSWGLIYLVRNR